MDNKDLRQYYDELSEPVLKLIRECNDEVIEVICKRIEEIGANNLTYADAHKIVATARLEDMKTIKGIIADKADKSLAEVEKMLLEIAENNDELLGAMYDYRGIERQTIQDNKTFKSIVQSQYNNLAKGMLNLTNTSAFVVDGKPTEMSKAYVQVMNRAVISLQSGIESYNTTMRKTVKELSENGIQVVDYDSGYHRRLDSAVRMNLLDGVRQMNIAYREEQGKQFGADGVEISAHDYPAPDHAHLNGRQFSKEEFEKMQNHESYEDLEGGKHSPLVRAVGELNCYHIAFPVILGYSKPVYTNEQLEKMANNAKEVINYHDMLGREKSMTRYECTQRQRKLETDIRKMKDQRKALKETGDEIGARTLNKEIRAKTRYYREFSNEVGLPVRDNRLR